MRIKGWDKFQHFKERKPPWIKLYRDILEDMEWFNLAPESAKYLVMIWLIASEEKGELPDLTRLAFRLRISEEKLTKILNTLNHWVIQDDIEVISGRYHDDSLETETETETETYKEEKEKEKKTGKRFTPPTLEEVTAYCQDRNNGISPKGFIDSNTAKGWVIGKNRTPAKDWRAMVRTWEKPKTGDPQEKPKTNGGVYVPTADDMLYINTLKEHGIEI